MILKLKAIRWNGAVNPPRQASTFEREVAEAVREVHLSDSSSPWGAYVTDDSSHLETSPFNMYKKKVIHNQYVDGNAYITVGDTYQAQNGNPFRQPIKGEKLKPMECPRFPSNTENGHFSKITYAGGGYIETNKYKAVTGEDRKGFGFGSKEASKRDEFSNSIRTEQYRTTMRKETRIVMRANQANLALAETIAEDMERSVLDRTQSTVDSITDGRTSASQKLSHDRGQMRETSYDLMNRTESAYRLDRTREKRLGAHRLSSMEIGESAWSQVYKPPSHGGKSGVKNFLDASHLSTPGP